MKLEFKHIAPYLPYGLHVIADDYQVKLLGYCIIDGEFCPQFDVDDEDISFNDPIKPILRPLSDLNKKITIDGKTFVPIIELCRISKGWEDEGEFIKCDINHFKVEERKSDSTAYLVHYTSGLQQHHVFGYKNGSFHHSWITGRKGLNSIEGLVVDNQILLFQKLYEWHFDLYGLIEKGLAVDIKTIKQ